MSNEETFDWKQAAKLWTEGKRLEVKQNYSCEWKPLVIDESASFYSFYSYRLRTEPVVQAKWARGVRWCAMYKTWFITPGTFNSAKHFIESSGGIDEIDVKKCFWPARFDSEGYLIIPEEFKGLK